MVRRDTARRRPGRLWLSLFAVCACFVSCLWGGQAAELGGDTNRFATLARLSLEDVLTREVTSVSKRPEKLFESAAAISVISGDDIRRSGARSFQDALRMAPGVSVGAIDANTWAVTVRGFNDMFSDKLLGLMDGRTVYSPLTSGVFWDVQDGLQEDIDRIEVIRGPGGTLWGANAVNGVVNIVTKEARDTQGLYLSGGGGNVERGFFGARYGDRIGENGYWRAYAKGSDRDNFPGGMDGAQFVQGGFRSDWYGSVAHYTLQGDYYSGESGLRMIKPTFAAPFFPLTEESNTQSGGNVLFRLRREFSDQSDLQIQSYYDRAARDIFGAELLQEILDIEFQHRFGLPGRQNFMYGMGYRYLPDEVIDSPILHFTRRERHSQVFNAFVQDEIDLVEDRLRLTLGTKLEHNDYTSWEVQPNARLAWIPTDRQTLWWAVSRAVQVPGRLVNDTTFTPFGVFPVSMIPVGPPLGEVPLFVSNDATRGHQLDSQEVIAYEFGYRLQPVERLALDAAVFYNRYDGFFAGTPDPPELRLTPIPHLFVAFPVGETQGTGESHGVEVSAQWQALEKWRLAGSYSYLQISLDEVARVSIFSEGKDPAHQFSLRSALDLPGNLEFDVWGRFVDRLPAVGLKQYFDLDVRLSWKPEKNLEIALVGQNLVEPDRFEFGQGALIKTQNTPTPRGGYVQVSYKF